MTAPVSSESHALADPGPEELDRVFALSGDRCHYNPKFLRANQASGATLVAFTLEAAGALVAGAVGYERQGRLFSKLTLPTPPVVTPAAPESGAGLWEVIRTYCRKRRVATVSVHSFEGQGAVEPPPLGAVRSRTPREEFVVDVSEPPDRLVGGFSENHRRNIKKAMKQGLQVRLVTSADAAEAHAALFRQSMERRTARGESVGTDMDFTAVRRLLEAGAGAIAQVQRESDGKVLASLLILFTATRAYYHSGGSAPEGMKVGASHYAMWRAMEMLRDRGVRSFCLGGAAAGDSEGLAGFKLGFNPRRIPLAHVVYTMAVPFPWSLLRGLLGR